MNFDDYEALWKRQTPPAGPSASLPALKENFELHRRRQAVRLFFRDWLEALTGIMLAGFLVFLWWQLGRTGWPLAAAIALFLGISGIFLRERLRTRRLHLGADATLLDKVAADLAELQHQRRLLLKLWSWYLAPCLGAMLIAGFTVVRHLPPEFLRALREQPSAIAFIAGYCGIVLPACFWGVWALNRRIVRRNLEPRIAELEKLRSDLLSSSDSSIVP